MFTINNCNYIFDIFNSIIIIMIFDIWMNFFIR